MIRVLLTAAVLALGLQGAAAEEKPPMTRDRFEADLARVIETSIKRKDTTHAVFHGCYDWHSAVHGHWALLRLDRVHGKHEAAARHVAKQLHGSALERERALLVSKATFEMPYGRAWFLRLALEFEQWAVKRAEKDATRLRPMADEIAASLTSWMDERKYDPNTVEYQNHSWAAAQLHAWYAHRDNKKGRDGVRAWVATWQPKPGRLRTFADDAKHPEFFSLYGNWTYAVLETSTLR